jgi:hypothetical protein
MSIFTNMFGRQGNNDSIHFASSGDKIYVSSITGYHPDEAIKLIQTAGAFHMAQQLKLSELPADLSAILIGTLKHYEEESEEQPAEKAMRQVEEDENKPAAPVAVRATWPEDKMADAPSDTQFTLGEPHGDTNQSE